MSKDVSELTIKVYIPEKITIGGLYRTAVEMDNHALAVLEQFTNTMLHHIHDSAQADSSMTLKEVFEQFEDAFGFECHRRKSCTCGCMADH